MPGVPLPAETQAQTEVERTPPPLPTPAVSRLVLPTNTWINLAAWCKSAGWTPLSADPAAAPAQRFTTHTSGGRLSLEVGNPVLEWNGHKHWLAYPPKLIDGAPHLFGLEVQKTLLPLAAPPGPRLPPNAVLVIDPGHGGPNRGAALSSGRGFEKDFTLDWALRVRDLLVARGWRVHLTRTNDTDVALADRVSLAERLKADLFVSLHFNSSAPKTNQAGLETYCLTPTGLPSNLVRDFADDLREVLPNNAFDEANLQVASRLHAALLRGTGAVDRGVRRARFMGVLRGQNRPAVLIEGGYLSHTAEGARIATAAYRQRLAEALVAGLVGLAADSPAPALAGQEGGGATGERFGAPLSRPERRRLGGEADTPGGG